MRLRRPRTLAAAPRGRLREIGSSGFTKFGAGTLDLRATNTYSGLTGGWVINAGTVRVNSSIGNSDVLLQGDATLQLRTDVTNLVFSSGTMTVRSTPTGSSTFSIDRDASTFTSARLGLANLVVTDGSRLNFGNANGYSLVITNSLTLGVGSIIRYDFDGTVITFIGNSSLPN